jgi:O-antigen/teichoic acid export membrane protein
VSTQAAVARRFAASARPKGRALAGGGLVSIATAVSGLLTFAFHVLAARSLGVNAYSQIAVLWAVIFVVAVVLFRPLEQTLSRTVAERLARGEEARSVLRTVSLLGVGILIAVGVVSALAWGPITQRLFLGNRFMTAMLVAAIAAYALSYVVRGLVAGVRWFEFYALVLIADAVARIVVAAPLVLVGSQGLAAIALVAAGFAGAIVPLRLRRSALGPALGGRAGPSFRLGGALAFAGPAGVIAAVDQLMTNGSPLLVRMFGGADGSKAAGIVFAATMLVRIPAYLFQGLAASLLPNFTRLQALEHLGQFRRSVVRAALVLLGAGVLLTLATAVVGPRAMRIFGSDFHAGRSELVLLAGGVALYLVASTLSQALLSLDSGALAAVPWLVSGTLFIAAYAIVQGGPLYCVSVAFVLASACSLVGLSATFAFRVSGPGAHRAAGQRG